MSKTTLKQIAHVTGVSVATVSKALKNYSDVSSATKEKVKKVAKELNYVPNSYAVNLRTQRSKTIGIIIPALVHYFFSNVIRGVLKQAEKHGYFVIVLQSNENSELERKQIDLLLSKGVDGILLSLSDKTFRFEHLKKVKQFQIPMVLFDKIAKTIPCSKVIINDRKAAYEAVSHLIDCGYKKIAHFRGELYPQNFIDRFLGYKKALEDHGIKYNKELVYLCKSKKSYKHGYKSAKKLWKQTGGDVDAIFTVNDVMAIGALKYFSDNQIKVPKDIAVFGFSNWFISSVVNPTLSTVKQPGFKMGKIAVKQLIKEIEAKQKGEVVQFEEIVVPTKLIIRESG